MFLARLILLVLATILICNDFTVGGETNDRIDVVLTELIKMNKNVEHLSDKVGLVEQSVQAVSNAENATAEHVARLEAKIEAVDQNVEFFATSVWKFVGRGVFGSHHEQYHLIGR